MEWFYILIIILGIILLLIITKLIANGPKTPITSDMTGKIVLITGASAGIGKETAISILNLGATVICASRSEEKTISIINKSKNKQNGFFYKLDLSSFESICSLAEKIKRDFPAGIDILINNAGQAFYQMSLSENGIERTIQTNHIGQFILTALLINQIKPNSGGSSKIINVASAAHNFPLKGLIEKLEKDSEFAGLSDYYSTMKFYAFSKLANVIHARFLAKNFPQITCASLHPGVVDTDIWSHYTGIVKCIVYSLKFLFWIFIKSEKMGAQTTLYLAFEKNEKIKSGGYYADCKVKSVGGLAKNEEFDRRIMKYTKELVQRYFKLEMPEELRKHLELVEVMTYGSDVDVVNIV